MYITLTILFVGCFIESNEFDEETIKKAAQTAESYVRNNYLDIETVEMEEVYRSPIDGISLDSTVIGQYEFDLGIDEIDFIVGSIVKGAGFSYFKNEFKGRMCDY